MRGKLQSTRRRKKKVVEETGRPATKKVVGGQSP